MFFIWINRLNVAFYTRSPYIILLGFLFLLADSVLNTFLFSKPGENVSVVSGMDPFKLQCNLGILATCVGMYGFIITLCMRMWRVYRVYALYTEYLAKSKQSLGKKHSPTHEDGSPRRSFDRASHDRNFD